MKNTIAIESIPIIMLLPDAVGIELAVDEAMSIPDIVLVGDIDIAIVVLISLMLSMFHVHLMLQFGDPSRCW